MSDNNGLERGLVARHGITIGHELKIIRNMAELVKSVDLENKVTLIGGRLVLAVANVGGPVDASRLNLNLFFGHEENEIEVKGFIEGSLHLSEDIRYVSSDKINYAVNVLNQVPGIHSTTEVDQDWQRMLVTDEKDKIIKMIVNFGYPDAEIAYKHGKPDPIGKLSIPINNNTGVYLTGAEAQLQVIAENAVRSLDTIGEITNAINRAYTASPKAVVWQSSNPSEAIGYIGGNKVFRKDGEEIGILEF